MKPALEYLFMGPLASPSFSQGFRWEDSRRRVRVVFVVNDPKTEPHLP